MKLFNTYLFFTLIFISTIFIFSSCSKTPVACLKSDKASAEVNEVINFTSCSENADIIEWDFGDGTTADGNSVSHSYSQPGTFTVKINAFTKKKKKTDESSVSITITSNGNSSAPNTWTKKADFGGEDRAYAVGFSIGNKGYVGMGHRLSNGPLKDFWEYDPATNTWTQKSDYGGGPRRYAVCFSIGTKGYVGTGSDENFSDTKDFWEYNSFDNIWTKKADFGGTARYAAVGFSIGNKGYLGTGYTNTVVKDFWEYDPATDTWLQKADFADSARMNATGFSIGNKGYVVAGTRYGYFKDCWEYDPATDTWLRKADLGGNVNAALERSRAFGFAIGSKGYFGTGSRINTNGVEYNFLDFLEYDPAGDLWTLKTAFDSNPQSARFGAVGFSIGNKGYAGTGMLGSTLKDFWEYTP